MKKISVGLWLTLVAISASAQAPCSVIPELCMTAPIAQPCPPGKHWSLAGSGIAHCVSGDPICTSSEQVAYDSLGNPSCVTKPTPPTCPNGATNYPTCTIQQQPEPIGMSIIAGQLGGIGYELGPGGAGTVTNADYYAGKSVLEIMDSGSQVYVIYPGVISCSAFSTLVINAKTLPFTNCLQNYGQIGSYNGDLTYWITSNSAGLQVGSTYSVVLR